MLKTSILATFALAVARAENLASCGSAPYYPSQYTCYDSFLCPVINGEPTLQCGDACYLPEAYRCVADKLAQQNTPAISYTLAVINSPVASLNGVAISACGQRLVVSNSSCTYCPDVAGRTGLCATFSNTTVYSGSLYLNTIVPGGQQAYLTSDGAIGYTQAHSAYQPPGATVVAVTAYSQGYLTSPRNASGWLACVQSVYGTWQLFAKLDGLVFPSKCYAVNLKVTEVPAGTVGAFQYS